MKHILFAFCMACALNLNAQTFETGDNSYTGLATYDSWEESPFRTGLLKGRAMVVDNPTPSATNKTSKCLAYQRSRWASNMYGVRVNLSQPFELTKDKKYVHALVMRPKTGRVMCIGLGRPKGYEGEDYEQFRVVHDDNLAVGAWQDAVFEVRGAGGIDINSLVFVTDLESTDTLTDDHIAYIDEIVVNNSDRNRASAGAAKKKTAAELAAERAQAREEARAQARAAQKARQEARAAALAEAKAAAKAKADSIAAAKDAVRNAAKVKADALAAEKAAAAALAASKARAKAAEDSLAAVKKAEEDRLLA
ncbi:MAG: hypothetical protein HUK00_09105, partial [Bacteroidaceae bacterium]|nr:hypothetical protein [Bacteroidaceae bacterium]